MRLECSVKYFCCAFTIWNSHESGIAIFFVSQAVKISAQNTSSTQPTSGSTADSTTFDDQLLFWMMATLIVTAIMQVWCAVTC